MGFTPCLLSISVYNTPFVTCWMGSTAQGTCDWGSRVFCAQGRIVFAPTLNANIRSGAVTFGVPIRLALRALDNMIFLSWCFNSYLHIA
jgi:hypothetical protein